MLVYKMEDFKRSYIELAEATYGVDYDFANGYSLDNSFYDIDFIGLVEATKLNLSQQSGDRQKHMESYNKSILNELKEEKYLGIIRKVDNPSSVLKQLKNDKNKTINKGLSKIPTRGDVEL